MESWKLRYFNSFEFFDHTGPKGFSVKTLNEYFKTFTKVVRSAVDDNGNQVHPRNWNLAFIGLPTVDKKKQHCPHADV